jgi:hypothetical protein
VMNCNFDEAQKPLDEARRIFRELGDSRRWEEMTWFLTSWHFYCGRYDESAAAGQEQLASAQARDDVESQLLARNQLAMIAVLRNESNEATSQLAEAVRLHDRGGNLAERVCTLGILALAQARAGDMASALATLHTASALLDQLGMSNLAIEGFSAMVEAVLAIDDAGAADAPLRALARKTVRMLTKNASMLSRVHRARAMILDAALLRREDRTARTTKKWSRAVERAERDHLPYESARARLEWAVDLPSDDPKRAEHLDSALATFQRLGTPLERARAERLRQGS